MESVVLDTKKVSEKYVTSNGNNKTRNHTIRAMVNNGSKFINYRAGRNSVNINIEAIKPVIEAMQSLNWENKQKEATDKNADELLKHIQQLQKQINQLKGE